MEQAAKIFEIERILADNNKQCKIMSSGTNSVISGYSIEGPTGLSNSPQWSDASSGIMGMLSDMANSAGEVFQATGIKALEGAGSALANIRMISPAQSIKKWKGLNYATFGINLLILNTSPTKDVIDRHRSAMSLSMGTGASVYQKNYSDQAFATIEPPQKDSINNKNVRLLSVKFGKWFYARNLVCTSYNFTPSKEIMSNGYPLYGVYSFGFSSSRILTYEDYISWFIV